MVTLAEIETAAVELSPAEKQELILFLASRLRAEGASREVFQRASGRGWQLITTPYAVAEVTRNLAASLPL